MLLLLLLLKLVFGAEIYLFILLFSVVKVDYNLLFLWS